MAIITAGYVNNAIGTATRIGLVGSATGTGSAFLQHEAAARSIVASKAALKGYSIGTTSTNAFVQMLVLGQWYFFAAGLRKGMEVPPAIATAIERLDEVTRDVNALPIPGLSPDTEDGIGGSKFSETSDTSTTARPQYFSRDKLRSW